MLLLALLRPQSGARAFAWVERRLSGLAHRPAAQIVAAGLLAVATRAVFLPWLGPPSAVAHDEQSLLLQAQTYQAGRLANPPHPFWAHFETFHVNQLPAYASMYFPGRGAPLAAGLALTNNPWPGVWLSFVLMAIASVWMLQALGFAPPWRCWAVCWWLRGTACSAIGSTRIGVARLPHLGRCWW